jgi:hypothetical protein
MNEWEIWEITEKYYQGLINYYDALDLIIQHRACGASIVAVDDGIKALTKHYEEIKK